MSILEREEGFLGAADGPALLEIAGICGDIREGLERQAYLLNGYLSHLARRLASTGPAEIVRMGTSAYERLFTICRKAIEGGAVEGHFAAAVREMIGTRPLDCFAEGHTRAALYALLLAEKYYPIAWAEASQQLIRNGYKFADVAEAGEIRGSMAAVCGTELLDRLDEAVLAVWQPVAPAQLFLQGYAHQMLHAMTGRDDETQKEYLALILDEITSG